MFTNMRYIYEVYRQKSFSRAAEKLFIAQPSLSITIKKAEARLGAQIFDRSTSPIRLTECGAEYIKCVEQIMDIQNGFENYISDLNELRTGSLAIGGSNFFTSYILPPLLTTFKTQYPRVNIRLVEADTANLEKQLFDGRLDLIVDNYAFNETVYKKHPFFSEILLLAVPKPLVSEAMASFALTTRDILDGVHKQPGTPMVPPALFEPLPFLLLRQGNDTRERADKLFARYRFKPNVVLKLDQQATAYHIAHRGLGVTLVSDTLVREAAPDDQLLFFCLDADLAQRENYFYYRQNRYFSRAMEVFLALAEASVI